MSLPRITSRPPRVIGTEDLRGADGVRHVTYEDGTDALFRGDVRIVDIEYCCSVEPASYVYFLIGENGVHHPVQVDHDGAMWLGRSFPREDPK